MDSRALRQAFLDFFEARGHTIVDSASLVPDQDQTLLFTNAGMVQFKEALALREDRGYTRAVTCQRCVRAGGKHNDLDNVGYTARHHTFFEMLGNFSFGDYFKRETIQFAWEFVTGVLALPKERLWVTVHEEDDEAGRIWIEDIGFDPERISRLGDDDNFWTMGDTGPCGPSSEIFYDHGPDVPGGPPGTPDGDLDRYVEIWNLVFTQYDRAADGTLTPLPRPCVDTGMGLERVSAILQKVHDNYDIDVFRALITKAAGLLEVTDLSSPSLKVIGDHIRAATFLIMDGVVPSNEGRGYVVRRIIRRALRHGRKLQSSRLSPSPFFHQLVETVVEQMSDAYPLLQQTQAQIEKVLLAEETQFEQTLDQGMKILSEAIQTLAAPASSTGSSPAAGVIPGDTVFKLYDTYGFPADLTADIAREHGLTIDMEGFEKAMGRQRKRARASSQFDQAAMGDVEFDSITEFVGYETLQCQAEVLDIVGEGAAPGASLEAGVGARIQQAQAGDQVLIVLDRTPFYAESGGQVGDTGELTGQSLHLDVLDTRKHGDTWLHRARVIEGEVATGTSLLARVNPELREATRLNHSATHLMHAALRIVLGEHVQQRGSLVDAARLRFDFSHFEALTQVELRTIERMVNEQIRLNTPVETRIMALEDARQEGALALFGEKYSAQVRVLTMGAVTDGAFSVELCGGTHVSRTGDIGIFRILAEQGVASGVRRIEAVTGSAALALIESMEDLMAETASTLKATQANLADKARALQEQNRLLEREVTRLNTKLASGQGLEESVVDFGELKLLVHQLDGADPRSLPDALDRLKSKIGTGVVVLGTVSDGKVGLIAGVTRDLTDKFNAGDLVNHVAVQVGGKGGGRPDMARAGGSNPAALPAALASVEAYIRNLL